MKINSICIVGGGSAGWMTAAAFSKLLKGTKVTLVESPDVSKIGVGESTIPEIHKFLDAIDVQDSDWMKECDASYKIGLNLVDFYEKNTEFIFPLFLGNFQDSEQRDRVTLRDPHDWITFKLLDKHFKYSYTDYVTPEIALMCKHHRITSDKDSRFSLTRQYSGLTSRTYAYQVDAVKFAKFLKEKVAILNGVKHVLGHVIDFNVVDEKLKSIKTKEGITIEADLFIDCTGFRSSILGGVFKTKHTSFKHLLNDSAFFTPVLYTEESKEKELEVVTDSTALGNGWVWNTPLWSRVGTGYVYSSKHIDKDDAELEFRNHLAQRYGEKRIKDLSFKSLQIRNGRHEKSWVSNVVAIGLSYGFIEPLESSGLYLVHEVILNLADILLRRNGHVGAAEISVFNDDWNKRMDHLLWFVSMHFFLSKRDETQYWRDSVDKVDLNTESFVSSYLLDYLNKINRLQHSSGDIGNNFIAYNMDVIPISYVRPLIKDENSVISRREHFIRTYNKIENEVSQLPTHYKLLSETIYK